MDFQRTLAGRSRVIWTQRFDPALSIAAIIAIVLGLVANLMVLVWG